MAIMLWRMAGKPSTTISKLFTDISDLGLTSQKAISWCANKGISKGTTDSESGLVYFDPKEYCTRAQLSIFLYRYNTNVRKLI